MQGRSVDEYARAPFPCLAAHQSMQRALHRLLRGIRARQGVARRADPRRGARPRASASSDAGIPYVAFGGGEPLVGAALLGDLRARSTAAGVALKIETDGSRIDDAAADRIAALAVQCVQISVDGATAATHERVRPGSSFAAAIAAIERLVARGLPPQFVFVPTRLNLHEIVPAFDLAVSLGCSAFVTGPLMRIGRAALAWDATSRAPTTHGSARSSALARARRNRATRESTSSIYPWDIVTEMETRLESPQAMLLVVPNGKVKLLNALPFSPADLRRDSLETAWHAYRDAWRSIEVRDFVGRCRSEPALLRHANETWAVPSLA